MNPENGTASGSWTGASIAACDRIASLRIYVWFYRRTREFLLSSIQSIDDCARSHRSLAVNRDCCTHMQQRDTSDNPTVTRHAPEYGNNQRRVEKPIGI